MRQGAEGVARADAVLAWLKASVPPSSLSAWTVDRHGTFRQRAVAELELRAALASADSVKLRAVLGSHAGQLVASHPPLEAVFGEHPPAPSDFLRDVDGLLSAVCTEGGASRRLGALSDLADLAMSLLAGKYVPVIEAERVRLAAMVPPQSADSAKLVEAVRAECAHARATRLAAPKAGSGPKAAPAGAEAEVVPAHLDAPQAHQLLLRFRGGAEQAWVRQLEALCAPLPQVPPGSPPGTAAMPGAPDPHRILAHCFTSGVLAVRRFAAGKVASLPLPVFSLPAVSGAPAHLAAYAAEAVLTGDDGVVAPQRGKHLVLPASMVRAGASHSWNEVDWEELVLLAKEALFPVSYTTRVPKGQEWTSEQRAEDLLRYGSRFVAAFGGGRASDLNSFGTLVGEWRAFLLAGETIGGEVHTDHVANARRFMQDSLRLAGHHGRAVMGDTNPLGQLAPSFVPAGAAPFGDLDNHRDAQDGVVRMASSFPTFALAMGVQTGLTPRGVAAPAVQPGPPGPKAKPSPGGPKATIDKKAKRKQALERAFTRARASKAHVRDGVLYRADGRTAPVAALAALAGCGVDDRCWPVVAASGPPAVRLTHCPCPEAEGHRGPKAALHARSAAFGAGLEAIFQGQRQ